MVMSLTLRQTLHATWQARLERAVVHDVWAGGRVASLEAVLAAAQTAEQRAQVQVGIATRQTPEAATN
jgi:hypothetical protein